MSEQKDTSQEKTEEPTPKRLQDAKKKGQVPRSRELSAMLVMMTGAVFLLSFGGFMVGSVADVLREGLTLDPDQVRDASDIPIQFRKAVVAGIQVVLPIMGVLFVAALAAPSLIGGWSFSLESVQPKLSKMNPISGFQRIFGVKALVELAKAIGKFGAVAVVAAVIFWLFRDRFLSLGNAPMPQGLFDAGNLVALCFLAFTAALIIVAAIDVPFQIWDNTRKLKMSKQEVKDEFKETEGKPEVKRKIRETQQEMSRRRMMEEVPKADVVVTNPSHFAVALRYRPNRAKAPVVVAKGVDRIALRIREIAEENHVPILEAPPLARALHGTTELGDEIPARLYRSVAEVLSWVYQLRRQRARGGPRPRRPNPSLDEEGDE
ncbi:flagellar biosynthetic protein FlhB [Natronospira proteinivora]|uniref:Flagellar biosynthetic protein FlhB n=1 Tax=Natronospira proteinivora TaxID=1807133 RepID=A0ABT1G570_9GAMM|nr:flagellar biosynthesis protein FlhB [Natronospira proteinivora]MCP1726449.1 flagellar biosynthetic protein FlhB [Natronospira proteinivora]